MNKSFFISLLAAFAIMLSVNVSAQERATGDNLKKIQKQKKELSKELKQKASKDARKQAKQYAKEGFRSPIGKLPLEKQLDNSHHKAIEVDTDGNPYWYLATATAIGGNQAAAALQAINMAKLDLAGQIQTQVTQLISTSVANDDMGQQTAASLSSMVSESKSIISATLGRTIPIVEVYRTLANKNVEVQVTIGYSVDAANQQAIKALRAELAKKSEELAEELDKLGY